MASIDTALAFIVQATGVDNTFVSSGMAVEFSNFYRHKVLSVVQNSYWSIEWDTAVFTEV
jgi:hypothetical protein